MVKAVIFDVFGTLLRAVDPHGPYFKLSKLVPTHSHLIKRHEMMTTDKPFAAYVEEAGATPEMTALEAVLAEELAGITVFEDVPAYLDSLKWRGYRVAVCSNLACDYGAKVRELLPEAEHYFLSYEVGAVKPNPAIYWHVASKLGLHPDECLFAGDSRTSDVLGPRKIGMHSTLVERHRFARPLHEQVDAVLAGF
ncbi:Alpha-D-glucose-1-phosphate phosphatase YihX [compost metagenome]